MGRKRKGISRREFLEGAATGVIGASIGAGMLSFLGETAHAAKNNIIFAQTQEPGQFNPLLWVDGGVDTVPEDCVFDALWDVNEEGKFIPNLAAKVPSRENGGISSEGLVWKIELKKGIKWHDGQPFTAKDVEFTYKSVINPKVAVRSRSGMNLIRDFKVIDDYHVEITLSKPYVPFIWTWQDMHIVPEHILSKVPDINTASFNFNPIGTGPFVFKERHPGSHIVYNKNPNYHGYVPKVETFIQKYVPDSNVIYSQFKIGEIDVLGLRGVPPERYEEAKNIPDRNLIITPIPNVEFIYFNCGKPQFQDYRVRKALYTAVDKKKIVKDIYYNTCPLTLSYLHPTHYAYNTNLKDPGYDPRKAAQMLDAAGWKVGSDGIREKDGVKLKFTMSTTAGARTREQTQQLIQQSWKEINVVMEIKNMPSSVVWGEYTIKSQFDTLIVGWNPPVGLDPDYTARAHSKQIPAKYGYGSNYTQYENSNIDKLLEEGVSILDAAKRKETYFKIQEILLEEVPFAPLRGITYIFGKHAKIKGYKMNTYTPYQTWNVQEWMWE